MNWYLHWWDFYPHFFKLKKNRFFEKVLGTNRLIPTDKKWRGIFSPHPVYKFVVNQIEFKHLHLHIGSQSLEETRSVMEALKTSDMRFHPKLPPTLANLGILKEDVKNIPRGSAQIFYGGQSIFIKTRGDRDKLHS